MTVATALLNADHVGVRDLREHLSKRLHNHKPIIVTDHGHPKKVLISYDDMMEIVEILDELEDPGTLAAVSEGRRAIKAGARGIPVSEIFQKIRSRK